MSSPDIIIIPDENAFPNNTVIAIKNCIQQIDVALPVVGRQLRPEDPQNEAVGVFAMQWSPIEDSYEMRGAGGSSEPTLSRYTIGIQCAVRDGDENRGLLRHATFSKVVRVLLYRDPQLAVALRALSVAILGGTERTQRYGIRSARYLATELSGSWLYLSTLEFWLETETV